MHTLFGTKHLILIAFSVAVVVLLFRLSKKLPFATVCKSLLYVGICSELVKIFYYILQNEENYGGILPKTDLPFHLCSVQIIFILIVNLTKNEKVKRFFLSFMFPSCLFGGIAAILLATNSSLNGTWVITAQYFLYHAAITAFALHLGTSKEWNLTAKDYFSCLKFLLALFFFATYINSILYDGKSNVNFMYVASPPQSGLPFLNENHGRLVYIVHYACLVLFCVTISYIKPIIVAVKEKTSAKHNRKPHDEQ